MHDLRLPSSATSSPTGSIVALIGVRCALIFAALFASAAAVAQVSPESCGPLQNATGDPAISLPLGRNTAGLPIGVQLASSQGHEARLLEVAYELEEAIPFARIQDA